MAFIKDKTGVRQTATNAATTLVTAFVQAGFISDQETALSNFETIRDNIFTDLAAVVDADNATFAEAEKNAPAKSKGSWGSKPKSVSGGKAFKGTAAQAADMELNFGKFKGCTLGSVASMTADEAAEYGHGEGDKPGLTYVKWLATNENNKYAAEAAALVLEARKASSDQEEAA